MATAKPAGAWGGKKSLAQVMKDNQKDSKVATVDPAIAVKAAAAAKRVPLPACDDVHIAHRYRESDGNDGSTAAPTLVQLNVNTTLVVCAIVVRGDKLLMTKERAGASGSATAAEQSIDVKGASFGPARPSKFGAAAPIAIASAAPTAASAANAKTAAADIQNATKAAAEKHTASSVAAAAAKQSADAKSGDSKSPSAAASDLWYVPSGSIDHFETIPNAVARIVFDETGVRVTPTHVQAIEHYPSLQSGNWMRVCVVATASAAATDSAVDTDRADWMPLSHFPDDGGASSVATGIELKRPDLIPLVSAYRAGRIARLPLARSDVGFASTLVEVALFDRAGALCLTKQSRTQTAAAAPTATPSTVRASNWAASIAAATATPSTAAADAKSGAEFSLTASTNLTSAASTPAAGGGDSKLAASGTAADWWYTLPVTHVTAEETIAFAANRLMRAKFGFLVDINGVAAIEHNARSDAKLDGVRFTVFAEPTPDASDRDPNFVGPPPTHVYVKSVTELDALHADGRVRSDLYDTLRSALTATAAATAATAGDAKSATPISTAPVASASGAAAADSSSAEDSTGVIVPKVSKQHRVTVPLIHI